MNKIALLKLAYTTEEYDKNELQRHGAGVLGGLVGGGLGLLMMPAVRSGLRSYIGNAFGDFKKMIVNPAEAERAAKNMLEGAGLEGPALEAELRRIMSENPMPLDATRMIRDPEDVQPEDLARLQQGVEEIGPQMIARYNKLAPRVLGAVGAGMPLAGTAAGYAGYGAYDPLKGQVHNSMLSKEDVNRRIEQARKKGLDLSDPRILRDVIEGKYDQKKLDLQDRWLDEGDKSSAAEEAYK